MDVVESLEEVKKIHGTLEMIKVDNGPGFISKEVDLWAYTNKVKLDFSRPGKPTDNAFIESFNGRLREECLNQHWFLNLEDAELKLKEWKEDYNFHRPHSSLGNQTPSEFAMQQKTVHLFTTGSRTIEQGISEAVHNSPENRSVANRLR